ncbi:hypothetical protein H0X10_02260 [Candidatus Saccharibacteria bacterium]|nr:hypothetical protein [Candidatus Saccharibacteria bacterium]
MIFEPIVVGDLGVSLINGKNLYDVLKGAASVIATHPRVNPSKIDVQL